jgi:glutamine amidotransferase
MAELEKRGLTAPILESIRSGKPFLGICLGLQLLFESSQENPGVRGFGVFKGAVEKFAGDFKIPHMGWNQIRIRNKACPILKDIADGTYLYFVHSYYVAPRDTAIAACTTDYGNDFVSMVWKDNIYATQFHPEKSQENGLKILRNFCRL